MWLFCILVVLFSEVTVGQYLVGKNAYHNHHEMTNELRHMAKVFPTQTHMYSIGRSAEGRDLWVLAISSHSPNKHLPLRSEVSLVANMHGDEAVGKELLLYLAAYLLEYYNYEPTIMQIMNNSRIHILPSMNPDGLASSSEGVCDGVHGRGNARKVDLNRNFPDYWEENNVEREPETKAILQWLELVPFTLSTNFHGGAVVANYPFDNNKEGLLQYSEAPDDDVLKNLALTYSKSHRTMFEGKTCGDSEESFVDGITNGADWYPVKGSLQDYQYAFRGTMATTIELSCCKYPFASTLVQYWHENKEPMLEYLKQANTGIKGFILDSENGTGLKVSLQIHGRKIRFSSLADGEFFRILLPGAYRLKIQDEFKQYQPKLVSFTIPDDRRLLVFNITLNPISSPVWPVHTTQSRLHFVRSSAKNDHLTEEQTKPTVSSTSKSTSATWTTSSSSELSTAPLIVDIATSSSEEKLNEASDKPAEYSWETTRRPILIEIEIQNRTVVSSSALSSSSRVVDNLVTNDLNALSSASETRSLLKVFLLVGVIVFCCIT